jgi:hypothetical protein
MKIRPLLPLAGLIHCKLLILNGGEGGIRTHNRFVECSSCRFQIAKNAKCAKVAVDHCTLLHANYGDSFINTDSGVDKGQ